MSSQPRDVLIEMIAKYGDPILTTPIRCEGLLKDFSGEHRREIASLMTCLRSGMVEQLCQLDETSIKAACPGLALRLGQESNIPRASAMWTVESWAVAIGLLDPSAATALRPDFDAPPSEPTALSEQSIEMPTEEQELPGSEIPDEADPSKDFHAKVFVSRWPVPDWSFAEKQVIVYPEASGQKPNLRDAVRDAVENTCLLLKPGLYKESLAIKRNLQIRADGEPGEIILEATSSSPVILYGACLFISGVTFKSVAGKDRKASAAVEVKSGHLVMEYCDLTSDSSTIMEVRGASSEVILRECHLHDGKAGGIVFQEGAVGYLEGCHFYQNKLSHVVIGKGCAPTFLSCKISNALMAGFYVNDGGAGLIENCDIWGNSVAGIQCQRKGNPQVRHCRISLNERYGVLVAERGEGSFEKCQIFDNTRAGITISGQSQPSFSGCQIFDNHGEGADINEQSTGEFIDCEFFTNESANVSMKGKSATLFRKCQVHDGQKEGIRLTTGAEGLFHQCAIFANGRSGLVVTDAKPVVQGCKFYNGMENGVTLLSGSETQFADCTFMNHGGTAVMVTEKAQARFERCDISQNLNIGIHVDDNSSPTLQSCTINRNGGVGFMCTKGGAPRMVDGEINENTGGGLLVTTQGKGRWENVSIIGSGGTGVLVEEGGSPVLRQVKVMSGKGMGIVARSMGGGSAEKCDVRDNAEGDWDIADTARLKRIYD